MHTLTYRAPHTRLYAHLTRRTHTGDDMTGFIGTPSMRDMEQLEGRITALEERWKDHPDYVRRGPTEAEWGRAIDESWAWIDGYAPRA